jgi:hypothetical protein
VILSTGLSLFSYRATGLPKGGRFSPIALFIERKGLSGEVLPLLATRIAIGDEG